MLASGVGGVRLTFSFGTPDLQLGRALRTKEVAKQAGRDFRVMADLAGEKFRLGIFEHGASGISVAAGQHVQFVLATTCDPQKHPGVLAVPTPAFFAALRTGATVVVGDGAVELLIKVVCDDTASAEVTEGGTVEHTRGLTIRGADFRPRSITDKDRDDLKQILIGDAYDVIALSFVSSPADVFAAREIAKRMGREHLTIAAKIETVAGIENLDGICDAADVVIAARGDLALALPWVDLPEAMDLIACAARSAGKPWILATQVVEGLERFTLPTCAETCDLAHWLRRGCSGVLLSRETAFGTKPIEAVSAVAKMVARWSNA